MGSRAICLHQRPGAILSWVSYSTWAGPGRPHSEQPLMQALVDGHGCHGPILKLAPSGRQYRPHLSVDDRPLRSAAWLLGFGAFLRLRGMQPPFILGRQRLRASCAFPLRGRAPKGRSRPVSLENRGNGRGSLYLGARMIHSRTPCCSSLNAELVSEKR